MGKREKNRSMSTFMKKEAKKRKELEQQEQAKREQAEAIQAEGDDRSAAENTYVPKSNSLLFFRQYNTYQALFEIFPSGELTAEACFSKVILYVMSWFKHRLGEENITNLPEIFFLGEDYPEPEGYADFDITKVEDINTLSFSDVSTAYVEATKCWVMRLVEPDNGKEELDLKGRTFTTEILVSITETSAVLGIREFCREPQENHADAAGFRPGFVRDIFHDEDLFVAEEGVGGDYRFGKEPIILNGKSSSDCEKLHKQLIANPRRQMPVIFIPEAYYTENLTDVNYKTASLLGYCHVVVLEKSARKLFDNCMNDEDLLEVSEDGQIIFYRKTALQTEYENNYYETSAEGVMEVIKAAGLREPLRKKCDFGGYSFTAPWWNKSGKEDAIDTIHESEEIKILKAEIDHMKVSVADRERDNDGLQRNIDRLTEENRKLDKQQAKDMADLARARMELDECESIIQDLKDDKKRLTVEKDTLALRLRNSIADERRKYVPLINMPSFDAKDRKQVIDWIRQYYSEVLIVHPDAEKSLQKSSRNISIRTLCMMIHYLAGYTMYRNEGGNVRDAGAARDYDPDNAAYIAEPVSSGAGGSTTIYEDAYTFDISAYNPDEKNVIMDMHVVQGKGRDADMIRVYFFYDKKIKKSIIGYMPDHLPTRSDPH